MNNNRLFSFRGTAPRLEFWIWSLVTTALGGLILLGAGYVGIEITPLGWGLLLLLVPLLWIGLAVQVRRLHDRGLTGWWALGFVGLPALLPELAPLETGMGAILGLVSLLLSLAGLVVMGFLSGRTGPNRYATHGLGDAAAVFS